MLTVTQYQYALELAVVAYVFCCELQKDKNIFAWYGDLINKLFAYTYGYILANPLGYCEKCFAGQLAFWLFLYYNWRDYKIDIFNTLQHHVIFISVVIFITIIIKLILNFFKKLNNE